MFLKNRFFYYNHRRTIIAGALVLFFFLYLAFFSSPMSFPVGSLVSVEKGLTLSETAIHFENSKVVRSPMMFKLLVRLFSGDGRVIAGDYFFDKKVTVIGLVKKITRGEYGLDPVRVTIHEGLNIFEIAEILENRLPDFDGLEFVSLAKEKEGYLFPDTYFFLPNIEPEQVISEMNNNFFNQIEPLHEEIQKFGRPLGDIVVMASILEKEARTKKTRETISGILWKRLDSGMRLQVDAVFTYINGKNTFELSLNDLDIDSPYNTYKYAGLPAGPITNPGLGSILATISPTDSPYWFYLSDLDGNMHYATTFDGHKVNKLKYLK